MRGCDPESWDPPFVFSCGSLPRGYGEQVRRADEQEVSQQSGVIEGRQVDVGRGVERTADKTSESRTDPCRFVERRASKEASDARNPDLTHCFWARRAASAAVLSVSVLRNGWAGLGDLMQGAPRVDRGLGELA